MASPTYKLWNATKTNSYIFNSTYHHIENIDGLGFKFDLNLEQGANSRYLSDLQPNFDPIQIGMIFGINTNAYTEFRSFASFVATNGKNKFIFEYNAGNGDVSRYCDVYVKEAKKGERSRFRVLQSPIVLERLSYWYESVVIQSEINNNPSEYDFPLEIPIAFEGEHVTLDEITIQNTFFDELPINLTINGDWNHQLFISVTDADGDSASITIPVINFPSVLGRIPVSQFVIDSLNKKVYVTFDSDVYTEQYNGYQYIDKDGGDVFLIVKTGEYAMTINYATGDTFEFIAAYNKVVLD